MFGPILAGLYALIKTVPLALKFLWGSKFLLTGGSMILSVWFYAMIFGFPFALGFVLAIFVHELGHVFFAWRQGIPVSAPVFIPGMGALILQKEASQSGYKMALIGIGGPLFGTAAGLVCWAIFAATGNPLFLALAFTTFLLNLFNLIPIYPLDGGRIIACISPYFLIVGYGLLIAAVVTGLINNPMIFIIVLLSVPQVWGMIKHGSADMGIEKTTSRQRFGMGAAYLGLAGFLVWGMGHTHITAQDHPDLKRRREMAIHSPTSSSQRFRQI